MLNKKLLSILAISAIAFTGCGSKEAAPTEDNAAGFTGTKTIETPYDPSGEKPDIIVTEMQFEEGKPVSVNLDVKQEDGSMKSELSAAGGYVMKEGEENAWHQQIDLLETFLQENDFDTTKVTLSDEAGHTDVVTGVTIKIPEYLKAVDQAISEAQQQ